MWMSTARFYPGEAARRVADGEPDLRLIPSAIGGDRDKRTGVILAKSIPAKKFGVTTGEPVAMALRKCPQLVLAKPDFGLYTRNSKAFIAICRRFAPVVEQVSIDECFLDMTGTNLLYPNPIAIAHTIKDTIFFPSSASRSMLASHPISCWQRWRVILKSQIRFTPCLHPKFRRSSGRCLWARCIRSAAQQRAS